MRLGNRRLTHKDHKKTTKNEPNPISRNWGLCCNVIKVAAAQHPFALWFFVLECSRRLEPIRIPVRCLHTFRPYVRKKSTKESGQQHQGIRKRISTLKRGRLSSILLVGKNIPLKNTHRMDTIERSIGKLAYCCIECTFVSVVSDSDSNIEC